ncbi:hypothetical protein HMPREF0080_00661 [Anaeroglobus geminatus F0357]|uniref:Uncharacterized protein n=1 Tax=Anaeroglobus geminatus F0357 TaxID=861450 RepID=G9YG96_9FIRM|nr:hypothetical protein HMPREF0080_00661 [Anaeroglobus geminatus F0357]
MPKSIPIFFVSGEKIEAILQSFPSHTTVVIYFTTKSPYREYAGAVRFAIFTAVLRKNTALPKRQNRI